jgi:hypothetical protein
MSAMHRSNALRVLTVLPAILLLSLLTATAAHAAAVASISVSADPTEDKPVTVTISGSTDANRSLYAYVTTAGSCAPTAASNTGGTYIGPSYGEYELAGSYTESYTYTPTDALTYRVCAYVAQGSSSAPDAVAEQTFLPRRPQATTAIAISADPTEDKPVSVTLSGTTEVNRSLYAYVTTGTCAPTAAANTGGSWLGPSYGEYELAGAYSESYTYTPPDAATYRVCSYVTEGSSAAPNATADATFATRRTGATGSIAISADPVESRPLTVTVAGTTEANRSLYAYMTTGACAPTASANTGGAWVGPSYGEYELAGSYTESYTYTPPSAGVYRVCAYLSQGSSSAPDALVQTAFAVRRGAATIGIAVDRSPYLAGTRRTASVSGTLEVGGSYATAVVAGTVCTPPEGFARTPVTGSGFSTTIDVDTAGGPAVSVCAYAFHGGEVYAFDQVTLTLAPVPAPVLGPDAPKGRIDSRRPTFAWAAGGSVFSDDFVLTDREGTTLLRVGPDGAWVPNGEEEDVDDASDYYGEDAADEDDQGSRAGYDRVKGAATYRLADGRAQVQPAQPLPPGSYRWRVERRRSDGQAATSQTEAFKIAGPQLTHLKVRVRRYPTTASAHPGFSSLRIDTTPYAYVRVQLRRAGRTKVMNVRWSAHQKGAIDLDWTCKRAGGAYAYKVTATDDDGHSRTATGTLRTITKARCAALKRSEQRARDRRAAAKRRREAAAERRRQAAARADLQRRIDNCHRIDGVARRWVWPDGSTSLVCVSPYGVYVL